MTKPNIVIMLADNIGYGDLGCYGSALHRTPNIDALAADGTRFTSFYSVSGVCTPSRAGLLTGCYPRRVNMHCGGTGHVVLLPGDPKGLHPDEITLARLLKSRGYATACIGKWHLGDQLEFMPTRHGFDMFYGCPYSEDMVPDEENPDWPPLPLLRDEEVIEAPMDRTLLTRRYTEEAIRFIEKNRGNPFFLYLPYAMPGSTDRPFCSPAFEGHSANGPYGDAVEELDWACGEVMRVLKEQGIEENTIVIWTSDNGAVGWEPRQGSNAPLRGFGYNTSEGAQRMPCIMHWPARIPAGIVQDSLLSMMDIYPTVSTLAGARIPQDRTIDGNDIRSIISGEEGTDSPYDKTGFFFYHLSQLQAVRSGPWKLYLACNPKIQGFYEEPEQCEPSKEELYDVRNDPGETREVAAERPEVVKRLRNLAEKARESLGDLGREGADQRPAGWVHNPRQWRLR